MSLLKWEQSIWDLNLPTAKAWQIIRMVRRHIDMYRLVDTGMDQIKYFRVRIPVRKEIAALYRMYKACQNAKEHMASKRKLN